MSDDAAATGGQSSSSEGPFSNPGKTRPWYQFRISLIFCLMSLVAAGIAGFQFNSWMEEAPWNISSKDYIFGSLFYLAPTVAAVVLLIGRGTVAVPMAAGFLVTAIGLFFFNLRNGFGTGDEIVARLFAFEMGALCGLIRLHWQDIRPWHLVLSMLMSFSVGFWTAPVVQHFF